MVLIVGLFSEQLGLFASFFAAFHPNHQLTGDWPLETGDCFFGAEISIMFSHRGFGYTGIIR
jgi:hypothetical protein